MRLNGLASVKSVPPQLGHLSLPSSVVGSWSARQRCLHVRQSTSGSVKFLRWPEASQIFGLDRMDGVQPDYFRAELDHRTPPGLFHVAGQQHAEGAVVIGRAEPAINLGGREHETPCLAQTDQFFHGNGHMGRLVGPSPAAGSHMAGSVWPAVYGRVLPLRY